MSRNPITGELELVGTDPCGHTPPVDIDAMDLTKSMAGTAQKFGVMFTPTVLSATYGSRHFYGDSQYSCVFGGYASGATGISVTALGGGIAGFGVIFEDAGIKVAADDDLCCFSGRINATVAQTLGDWHGVNLYLRNSDQALTNNLIGFALQHYTGSGGSTKTLRGAWFDFLEHASSPPTRDWIMCGGQLTLAAGGTGNVTGFYFNNNSGADHATYGVWIRGRQLYGIHLGNVTPDDVAGALLINLVHLGTSDDTGILTGAGAPATVLSGKDHGRGKGTLYIDTTNGRLYINEGTAAAPTWAYMDSTT